jgi:hypothetical protein
LQSPSVGPRMLEGIGHIARSADSVHVREGSTCGDAGTRGARGICVWRALSPSRACLGKPSIPGYRKH